MTGRALPALGLVAAAAVAVRVTVTDDPVGRASYPPAVPGFAVSRFPPLVYEAVRRCLGEPPADELVSGLGDRTAIALVSCLADATSNDLASQSLAAGDMPSPLLFHQAVPVSILGAVSRAYNITGPVNCVSLGRQLSVQAFCLAATLLAAGDVAQVLLIAAELRPGPRAARVGQVLAPFYRFPTADVATALLLRRRRRECGAEVPVISGEPLHDDEDADVYGSLAGLAAWCRTRERFSAGPP